MPSVCLNAPSSPQCTTHSVVVHMTCNVCARTKALPWGKLCRRTRQSIQQKTTHKHIQRRFTPCSSSGYPGKSSTFKPFHLQQLGGQVGERCRPRGGVRRRRRQHEGGGRARHVEGGVHLVPQPQPVLLRRQRRGLRERRRRGLQTRPGGSKAGKMFCTYGRRRPPCASPSCSAASAGGSGNAEGAVCRSATAEIGHGIGHGFCRHTLRRRPPCATATARPPWLPAMEALAMPKAPFS